MRKLGDESEMERLCDRESENGRQERKAGSRGRDGIVRCGKVGEFSGG